VQGQLNLCPTTVTPATVFLRCFLVRLVVPRDLWSLYLADDFVFKADHFAREYGDVNPGIPFWPEGGDTANLSASLREAGISVTIPSDGGLFAK